MVVHKKGQKWIKAKTTLMKTFEKETGKSAVYRDKITGQFEYWLWQKEKKLKSKPKPKAKPKTKPKLTKKPDVVIWVNGILYELDYNDPYRTKEEAQKAGRAYVKQYGGYKGQYSPAFKTKQVEPRLFFLYVTNSNTAYQDKLSHMYRKIKGLDKPKCEVCKGTSSPLFSIGKYKLICKDCWEKQKKPKIDVERFWNRMPQPQKRRSMFLSDLGRDEAYIAINKKKQWVDLSSILQNWIKKEKNARVLVEIYNLSKTEFNEIYEEDIEFDPEEIENGDYVDFGAYGNLYVVHRRDDRNFWVTDLKEERYDDNVQGWIIGIYQAERIINKG